MDLSNNFRGEFEVSFKNKKVPAMFTMNALRLLLKNEKVELNGFDNWVSSDPLTAVPLIAYYSVVNASIHSKKKFNADKEVFIAEMLDSGQLEIISDAIGESLSADAAGKK